MKGEIRPAFGYSARYPLATLPIDNDILEDKWAATHPALVLEKKSGKHGEPAGRKCTRSLLPAS
jgi:hypothetical protein